MKKVFSSFIDIMFSVIMFLIMIILLFFNYLEYSKKNYISEYNIYALLLGFFILVILFIFIKKCLIKFNKIYLVTILLSLFQILLIYSYYFIPGWDAGIIINNSFNLVNNGELISSYYFSVYPNNILILNIYYYIILFLNFVNLAEYAHFILVILMILISNVSGLLMHKVLNKIFQNNIISWLGYIYFVLLIYISPWISIPYSDSFALIFPVLLLYIYISVEKMYIKWFLLSLIFVITFHINPQASIIFIAIVLFDFIFNKNNIKIALSKFIIIFVTIYLSFIFVNLINYNIKNTLDKEWNIGYLHYLKMGLNESTNGDWNYDDVMFSQSFYTKEDRDAANLVVIKDRLKNFNIHTFAKHYSKKTLLNYNDGTFSWEKEDEFYLRILPKENILSKITRNIYYSEGKYYKYFSFFQQASWLVILLLCFISVRNKKYDNDYGNNYKPIIYMTLIGLFIFLTLFEARARYLFTNVPIFIICAMYGLENIINRIKILKLNQKK